MKHPIIQRALCASISIVAVGAANAALIDRGGGLVYDTDLNITWLADANYAMTSGYSSDGRMTWQDAVIWAQNFDYYDSVRDVTYTEWRLPAADISCYGHAWNCTTSEMGHLFYSELGGIAGTSIAVSHGPNYHLFINMQAGGYWTGTEEPTSPGSLAFDFFFDNGYDTADAQNYLLYAWAVHAGDLGASAVPAPAASWLLGSGVLGLVGMNRMRRR